MMTIDDVVLMDSSWMNQNIDSTIRYNDILDMLNIDPIEKDMFKRRMKERVSEGVRRGVPINLAYVGELVHEQLRYYIEDSNSPLVFTVSGLHNSTVYKIANRFFNLLSVSHDVRLVQDTIQPFSVALECIPRRVLVSLADVDRESCWKDARDIKGEPNSTMTLEYIGSILETQNFLCIVYDRFLVIQGYVVIRL